MMEGSTHLLWGMGCFHRVSALKYFLMMNKYCTGEAYAFVIYLRQFAPKLSAFEKMANTKGRSNLCAKEIASYLREMVDELVASEVKQRPAVGAICYCISQR